MRKEREKKQVSGVATADSLDNCEQTFGDVTTACSDVTETRSDITATVGDRL